MKKETLTSASFIEKYKHRGRLSVKVFQVDKRNILQVRVRYSEGDESGVHYMKLSELTKALKFWETPETHSCPYCDLCPHRSHHERQAKLKIIKASKSPDDDSELEEDPSDEEFFSEGGCD